MIVMINICIIFLGLTCSVISEQSDGPIVRISDGEILGKQSTTPNGKPYFRFHGIPYAQPPLGNLRLADPQPPIKWSDTKNCTSRNVVCLQMRAYFSELESEDCLVLNVYTPKLGQNTTESDLAVMVYIYGGGFYIGNSTFEAYGPDFLIERDVVIVTLNYRLGAFGFLSTGDHLIPGNFGLKDQQFALKWVKNNINAFGGDPGKVTVFGNSAGAASIGYHIMNEESSGLFRAAIMSSGSPFSSWAFQRNPPAIALLTVKYINDSEKFRNSNDILQFLRGVPALDLRKASQDVYNLDPYEFNQFLNGYFYGPINDYYLPNGFVKKHTYEAFETGNFSHIPMMLGIVSEEGLSMSDVKEIDQLLFKSYDSDEKKLLADHISRGLDNEGREKVGKIIHEMYVQETGKLEEEKHSAIKFMSDQGINNGVIKNAYLASNYTDIYLYQFSYDGLMGNYAGSLKGAGAVTHTEDIQYIWRSDLPSKNNMNLKEFPENDLLTQNRLLTLFVNFAKDLNPTPIKDETLQGIIWKPLDPNVKDKIYLDIDANLTLKTNLKHETFSKWNELFLEYAVRPYETFR